MLKIGDQVVVNNCLVNYSNVTQVGKFRGKIVQISDHPLYIIKRGNIVQISDHPLYIIKLDNSTVPIPNRYEWAFEKELSHIITICA